MALGGLCDSRFPVTLAGSVLVEIVEHHLVVVWGLRSLAIVRGFVLTPRKIRKGVLL